MAEEPQTESLVGIGPVGHPRIQFRDADRLGRGKEDRLDHTFLLSQGRGFKQALGLGLLFASAEPVSVAELNARMPHGADANQALSLLIKRYDGRGVRVVKVGEGWAIRTAPDLGFLMQKETQETRKLSRAAIETLAIIAYHQPVTRAEIEEIRGVSVSRGTVDQLLEMEWIKFGRRRMTPGRPVTYVVTPAFLDHFGLESARDLPGLKELRAAGLLDNRPPPGADEADEDGDDGQDDMFSKGEPG